MSRIVLSGYYGYRNIGDEALLDAIVQGLRAMQPDLDIAVLSRDPAGTQERLPVRAVSRLNPMAVLRSIAESDLVLSGGGTLLQDATSLRSLIYYAAIMIVARALGKPVMVYANGLGPLRSAIGRQIVRIALRRADRITWRDEEAAAKARELLGEDPVIRCAKVTADPVFLLQPVPRREAEARLIQTGATPQGRWVGISLRPWKTGTFLDAVTEACRQLQADGFQPVFLPMQPTKDLPICRAVAEQLSHSDPATRAVVVEEELPANVVLGMMGCFHFVVAMRLHALMMAVAGAVPSVGIVYDPKVASFLRTAGLPSAGTTDRLTKAVLLDRITHLLEHHAGIQDRLRGLRKEFADRAQENAREALRLLARRTTGRESTPHDQRG